MVKNGALVRVSLELLAERLGLPAGVRILGVAQKADDILEGTFLIVIEHPALPQRPEGCVPQVLSIQEVAGAVSREARAKEFAEDVKRHRIRMP